MAAHTMRWMASLLLAAWALLATAQEEADYDLKKIALRTHSLQSVSLNQPDLTLR